ncbi:protein SanA, affects membrane permeability for vancomycin [Paenibacillus sp. UNCCL117]|uniref:YdcF family protein n=1 Tax=unclassified Paenibacillus TaxID=185978 RepID=UPI00088B3F5F|nr:MULTISPECIES: YdcF family protein [unclassified Paenibacillus]SDC45895.1 protein SanA, affects membrane permeability for vancomycin [Paenibacillus sp. cl123]SFW12404.1 protein SanA, affects membrane permeability for vancomycin [Paenibacillus sp. UNCCL117]
METQKRGNLKRIGGRTSRLLLGLMLVFALGMGGIQWRMITLPDQSLPPADVGIVLGAALWQTEPSPALKERLNRAAELYKEGVTPRLIVSGGYDREDSELTEAEGMRNYLVKQGIPAEHIELEQEARSTYENLKFSQAVMERHGWRSAVIITHRYHAVRALDIARYVGYEQPKVSPMDSSVLMMAWHRSRETLAIYKWEWDKLQLVLGRQLKG